MAFFATLHALAQQKVEATVTDRQTGETLPFANVYRQGRLTTLSNINGSFALEAEPDDTLRISYLGYKPVSVVAGDLPDVVRLQPSTHYLPEVVVMPLNDRMKRIIKATTKAVKKHREAKSIYFFRQSTYVDGTQRNMMEAFFDARSALTLQSIRLITGRIAEGGDVFYGADLYRLSQIRLLEKDGYKVFDDETIVPLDDRFRDYYKTHLRTMDDDGHRLHEISFQTNDSTRLRPIVTGTLYADAEQLLPVKMKGRLKNITVFNRSIEGSIDGEMLPVDVTFEVTFNTERRFPEVTVIVVTAAYSDAHHDYRFVSLIYNTGTQKLNTKRTPAYIVDLRKQIKRQRFDRGFWNRHETIKRTEIEQMLNELE